MAYQISKSSWHYRFIKWVLENMGAIWPQWTKSDKDEGLPSRRCEYWALVMLSPLALLGGYTTSVIFFWALTISYYLLKYILYIPIKKIARYLKIAEFYCRLCPKVEYTD